MEMTSDNLKDLLHSAMGHYMDNRDTDALALAAIVQGYALVSIAESLSKIDIVLALNCMDDSAHHLGTIAGSLNSIDTVLTRLDDAEHIGAIAESLARMTSPATIEEALSMYFKHIDEQLKAPQ